MLLAVDLDGPRYAARTIRERDRQRGEQLVQAGWVHHRVSAIDVFRDPAGEVERIRRAWIRAMLDRERQEALSGLAAARAGDGREAAPQATAQATAQAPEHAPEKAPAGSARPDVDTAVLPRQTSDDTDAGWGETPAGDDDERIRRERPPHW
jgi:hypothetical protein